jgi:hypothetical protein
VTLLTVAIEAAGPDDLEGLVEEFLAKDDGDLVVALVALSRALCMATTTLVHVIDDDLTDEAAGDLSDDDLRPMAIAVLRRYALAAANQPAVPQDD